MPSKSLRYQIAVAYQGFNQYSLSVWMSNNEEERISTCVWLDHRSILELQGQIVTAIDERNKAHATKIT